MGTACHFSNSSIRAFQCAQPDELDSQNIMKYWINQRMWLNDQCYNLLIIVNANIHCYILQSTFCLFNKHSLNTDKIQDCSEYTDYRVSIYSILHSNRLTDFTLDHKITTENQLPKKKFFLEKFNFIYKKHLTWIFLCSVNQHSAEWLMPRYTNQFSCTAKNILIQDRMLNHSYNCKTFIPKEHDHKIDGCMQAFLFVFMNDSLTFSQ